jgi:hypothetical protein
VHVNDHDPLHEARSIVRACVMRRSAARRDRSVHESPYLALIFRYLAAYYAALPLPPESRRTRKPH